MTLIQNQPFISPAKPLFLRIWSVWKRKELLFLAVLQNCTDSYSDKLIVPGFFCEFIHVAQDEGLAYKKALHTSLVIHWTVTISKKSTAVNTWADSQAKLKELSARELLRHSHLQVGFFKKEREEWHTTNWSPSQWFRFNPDFLGKPQGNLFCDIPSDGTV